MHKLSDINVLVVVSILINLLTLNGIVCESLLLQPIETQQSGEHLNYPIQPELVRIFENCHKNSSTFDPCIKTAFNELRAYFKTGK